MEKLYIVYIWIYLWLSALCFSEKERDKKIWSHFIAPWLWGIFCEFIALDSLFLCCCKCLVMHVMIDSILTHARFERGEVDRTKMKRTSWLRRRKQEPAALWVAGESKMHFCINNISCPLLSSSLYAWKRIHFMLRYIVEIKKRSFCFPFRVVQLLSKWRCLVVFMGCEWVSNIVPVQHSRSAPCFVSTKIVINC